MKSTCKKNYTKRMQWFYNHIGKRVYRNKISCECEACINDYKYGLKIDSKMEAESLFYAEFDYLRDGIPLKFFDNIEERDEFEKTLQHEENVL